MNMLVYNLGLRILRKREEHHRVSNDADLPAKREGLYGYLVALQILLSPLCISCSNSSAARAKQLPRTPK